ncbi:MAG: hypothetical protein ACRYFS_19820 [Janthinobacterium lividum]
MQLSKIFRILALYFFGIISLLGGYFSYGFVIKTSYTDDAALVSLGLFLLSPIFFKLAADTGVKNTNGDKTQAVVAGSSNFFITLVIGVFVGILVLFFALTAFVAFSGSGNF